MSYLAPTSPFWLFIVPYNEFIMPQQDEIDLIRAQFSTSNNKKHNQKFSNKIDPLTNMINQNRNTRRYHQIGQPQKQMKQIKN